MNICVGVYVCIYMRKAHLKLPSYVSLDEDRCTYTDMYIDIYVHIHACIYTYT